MSSTQQSQSSQLDSTVIDARQAEVVAFLDAHQELLEQQKSKIVAALECCGAEIHINNPSEIVFEGPSLGRLHVYMPYDILDVIEGNPAVTVDFKVDASNWGGYGLGEISNFSDFLATLTNHLDVLQIWIDGYLTKWRSGGYEKSVDPGCLAELWVAQVCKREEAAK